MIWPGVRLETSHHYVVALRHLVDTAGRPVEPSPAFLALRYMAGSTQTSCCLTHNTYHTPFEVGEKLAEVDEGLRGNGGVSIVSGACVRQMTAVNGNISPLICIHAVFTASPRAACCVPSWSLFL